VLTGQELQERTNKMTAYEFHNKLQKVAESISKTHKVPVPEVYFNARLIGRTAAMYRWWGPTDNIQRSAIYMSLATYLEYGEESMTKHFLHELAHHLLIHLYGDRTHGDRFKKTCVALGGSMNAKLAGEKYKEAATHDFLPKRRRRTAR